MLSLQTVVLAQLADTAAFAQQVYQSVKSGDCIALSGNIGAGKTTFASALIAHAAAQAGLVVQASSPTFSLLHVYDMLSPPIAHGDAYRIVHAEQFLETGFTEYLNTHLCLIEWPENIAPYLPAHTIWLHFEVLPNAQRHVRWIPKI